MKVFFCTVCAIILDILSPNSRTTDSESRFAVRPYDQVLWDVGSQVELSKNIYIEDTTISWNDLAPLVGVLSISFYRVDVDSRFQLKHAAADAMKT